MPTSNEARPCIGAQGRDIIARIESALEKARWREAKLRGIYLDHDDYADFSYAETLSYQERTGSTAILWPLAYEHVLILGAKAVPVQGATRSAVYTKTGERIIVPKQLSKRCAA